MRSRQSELVAHLTGEHRARAEAAGLALRGPARARHDDRSVKRPPPAGSRRRPAVFRCQLLSSQWVTDVVFSQRNSGFHTSTRVFAGGYASRPFGVADRRRVFRMRVRRAERLRAELTAAKYAAIKLSSVRERDVCVLCRVADSVGHPTVCRDAAELGWRETSCGESLDMTRPLTIASASMELPLPSPGPPDRGRSPRTPAGVRDA